MFASPRNMSPKSSITQITIASPKGSGPRSWHQPQPGDVRRGESIG